MDERKAKISIQKAYGNASKNSLKYRLNIPTTWMQEMDITKEGREVDIKFDGEKIIITKSK